MITLIKRFMLLGTLISIAGCSWRSVNIMGGTYLVSPPRIDSDHNNKGMDHER